MTRSGDTGIGVGSQFIKQLFRPKRHPIESALADFGINPNDVSVVINSRLHFNHCGNNGLFTNADVVVQAAELEAARQPRYTVRKWFDYDAARFKVISGDTEIAAGINVIASSGHTPGHQSVLVDDGVRRTLIAAQAAWTAQEYQSGGAVSDSF